MSRNFSFFVVILSVLTLAAMAANIYFGTDASAVGLIIVATLSGIAGGVLDIRREEVKHNKICWEEICRLNHQIYENKLRAKTLSFRLYQNLSKWREIFFNFKKYEIICEASILDAYNQKYCKIPFFTINNKKYDNFIEAAQDGYTFSDNGYLLATKDNVFYDVIYKEKNVSIRDKKYNFRLKYANSVFYTPFDEERKEMKNFIEYTD